MFDLMISPECGVMQLARSPAVPREADLAVVAGDSSLEPYVRRGENIYISRRAGLLPGEVGLFDLGDTLVCRQWLRDTEGNVYLFALNRENPELDLTLPAGTDFKYLGKVLLPETPPLPGVEDAARYIL